MSAKRSVIAAVDAVNLHVTLRTGCYSPDGRCDRIIMLAEWKDSITRFPPNDFFQMYSRHMASPKGDTACDLMDEVFQELGITTIEQLRALLKPAVDIGTSF